MGRCVQNRRDDRGMVSLRISWTIEHKGVEMSRSLDVRESNRDTAVRQIADSLDAHLARIEKYGTNPKGWPKVIRE